MIRIPIHRSSLLCWLFCLCSWFTVPGSLTGQEPNTSATETGSVAHSQPGWVLASSLSAEEAHQAAAADEQFLYAINNTTVARYDRQTGMRTDISRGPASHLNSGWIADGKLYCAHSNYPQTPERSEIKVLDLESMELTTYHDFHESPHGSLTWAIIEDGYWWCNFAHYGDQNHRTVLVQFDLDWNEIASWTYPPEVLADLGRYSISGAVWRDGMLLATGHDKPVLYRLKLPDRSKLSGQGGVLKLIETVAAPFTGQGIADDPVTGGLVGINRAQRRIVLAEPQADRQ